MNKVKLTQSEIYFLANYSAYKSFARRDNFSCQYALKRHIDKYGTPVLETYDQLEASLIEKKILARSKNGTVRSKLDYNETKNLIAYQTDSKESLLKEIKEMQELIQNEKSHYNTMPNLQWPYNGTKENEYSLILSHEERLSQIKIRLNNVS